MYTEARLTVHRELTNLCALLLFRRPVEIPKQTVFSFFSGADLRARSRALGNDPVAPFSRDGVAQFEDDSCDNSSNNNRGDT